MGHAACLVDTGQEALAGETELYYRSVRSVRAQYLDCIREVAALAEETQQAKSDGRGAHQTYRAAVDPVVEELKKLGRVPQAIAQDQVSAVHCLLKQADEA